MPNRVLIVDDEETMLRTFQKLLEDEDYEIATCLSGEEALRRLSGWQPDIIISDYQMQRLDGLTFLSMAADICPDSVRMLLTGYADVKVAQHAINEAAVSRFITKPFDPDALLETMRLALDDLEQKRSLNWTLEAEQASNQTLKAINTSLERRLSEKNQEVETTERFLRNNYGETIRILLLALEQRQPGFYARALRVAEIARTLVKESGENWLEEMAFSAGLLSDVGYLALPQIEKYPPPDGGLGHSYWGMRLLQNSMFSNVIPAAIEAHHENWDGSGPSKLAGMQIPFLARCLRLAEALSTFSSAETPASEVIGFLDARNGRQFDPALTASAIHLVLKHGVKVFLKRGHASPDIFALTLPLHS